MIASHSEYTNFALLIEPDKAQAVAWLGGTVSVWMKITRLHIGNKVRLYPGSMNSSSA